MPFAQSQNDSAWRKTLISFDDVATLKAKQIITDSNTLLKPFFGEPKFNNASLC